MIVAHALLRYGTLDRIIGEWLQTEARFLAYLKECAPMPIIGSQTEARFLGS